jgi:hypothetical protein
VRKPTLTVVALTALFAITACSGDADTDRGGNSAVGATSSVAAASPTSAGQPQTIEAARAAAQAELDAYAAGDWKGAWDLWTKTGKAAISRDDYARLHVTCKTQTGITFEITTMRLESPSVAVVNWKRLIVVGSHEMHYEDGQWRFQPDAAAMADYAKGIDKIIADRKADGNCG